MKDTIANLQAARDRLMPKVTACWGDAFDGDFDSMLEAINEMKRYHANIDADRAEFRQLAGQRAELLEALDGIDELFQTWQCSFASGIRPDDNEPEEQALWDAITEKRAAIANATQQRNATGGEG